jgi:RecA-family ATPase
MDNPSKEEGRPGRRPPRPHNEQQPSHVNTGPQEKAPSPITSANGTLGATAQEWDHWSQTLGLTKDLLPVVCNQQATISTHSKLKILGKAPSGYVEDGTVCGITDWPSFEATPQQVLTWRSTPDYGICVQARAVRAIDSDIDDASIASSVWSAIERHCHLPVRFRGNTGKFLMPFRLNGPFPKRTITTAHGIIEFLGDGQQFVAAGQHVSGFRYEWFGGLPTEIPELSPEAFSALFAELQATFGVAPAEVTRDPAAIEWLPDETIRDLRSALYSMRSDDRDLWQRMGHALKTLANQGRGLWLDWSATSEEHDPGPDARTWDSFKPNKTNWRAVFTEAQERGWVNPMGKDDRKPPSGKKKPETDAPSSVRVVNAADIQILPQDWLWRYWLARGVLHLIAGSPGTGKSTVAVTLAAILTTPGSVWPDGSPSSEVGDVLIWTGEDSIEKTLLRRLVVAGADLTRVSFVRATTTTVGKERAFDPSTDMDALMAAAAKMPNLKMLIMDPVVLVVKGDSHKGTEVRRGMQPLCDLSEELNVAVIGITHFAKNSGGRNPIERVIGSIAFSAVARLVLAFAERSEDQGGGYIMVRAKSNIGPSGDGFAYDLDRLNEGRDDETTKVTWTETLEGKAADLLKEAERRAKEDDEEEGGGDRLKPSERWLLEFLKSGPKKVTEVDEAAKANGISEGQLKRARKTLCVWSKKDEGEQHGSWTLHLPTQP